MDKYKLPVNKKEYRSKANIILYKYLYLSEHGEWPSLTNKKTGKTVDWKNLNVSKLMDQKQYASYKNIPLKLRYLFAQ